MFNSDNSSIFSCNTTTVENNHLSLKIMLRLLLRFFTIEWELVVEEHMMGSFHKLEQHKFNIKECNKFLRLSSIVIFLKMISFTKPSSR